MRTCGCACTAHTHRDTHTCALLQKTTTHHTTTQQGYEDRSLRDIASELFSYADGCTFSGQCVSGFERVFVLFYLVMSACCACACVCHHCHHTHNTDTQSKNTTCDTTNTILKKTGKKEALANVGGLLCCNDDALYEQLRNLTIVVEGYPTYVLVLFLFLVCCS